MNIHETGMHTAIEEAKKSLREGNHGFGSVIIKNDEIIAQAHDEEETKKDCTSHAEINAIKNASLKLGKNLSGCTIIATHEPCPMCASAIVWSGIDTCIFGFSITESISQGRQRIPLNCRNIFESSGRTIKIIQGFLNEECKILYLENVRFEIKKLKNFTEEKLKRFNEESKKKRIEWFKLNQDNFDFFNEDKLESAYRLLLCRFGINQEQAPVIGKNEKQLVLHSRNFCPTLEACKILDLDTRYICKHYNENATDFLIKQVDASLSFRRNYEKIRPYSTYCEESIVKNNDYETL